MHVGAINWDAVGAVAEALSAVGVIVTLLFLISQIRQNTAATRSAAAAAYSQATLSVNTVLASNTETTVLFIRFLDNPSQLTQDERHRGDALVSLYLHGMDQACDLYREGVLTEEKWQSRFRQIVLIAKRPGFTEHWKEFGKLYTETFASYVNRAMKEFS